MPPEKIPAQQAPEPVTGMPETGKETKTPPAFELKADEKPTEKGAKEQSPDGAQKSSGVDQGEFTLHKTKKIMVTVPKGAKGKKLRATVVYGGLVSRGGSKENMYDWTPASYKGSHVMIFANHDSEFADVIKPEVASIASQGGFEVEYQNLLGFSKGGETINRTKANVAWKLIGLIDPSVFGSETYPCLAYMVWDYWNAPNVDNRKKLHDRIVKGDVKGESKHFPKLGHLEMPAKWYAEFGGKL